ncbi:MAG: glycosyltransferase [Acidimicrobiales bacterium]
MVDTGAVAVGESDRLPAVRVGIVSWNTAGLLEECLLALPAALGALDAEVVVVDNASSDASVAVAEGAPGVTVVRNPVNVGYGRAINQALGGSDAEVLIALNPDTVVPPGALATLVRRLVAQPDVGLVAPRLVWPDGADQQSVYRFPSAATCCAEHVFWAEPPVGTWRRRLWSRGSAGGDRSGDVDWAVGAVHVLRRRAVGPGGPYSVRWFMYNEDLALCWDLAAAGWRRRLEADVEVVHVGNAAARQRWGVDPSPVVLAGTYDWYAMVHGPGASRRWALLNLVGSAGHGLALAARSWLGSRSDRRTRALVLWRQLPVHARALAFGPPAPSAPADRDRQPPPGRPTTPGRWPPT